MRWIRIGPAVAIVAAMTMAVSLGGCGDYATSPQMSNMQVRLTDNPTDELSQVRIFFSGLTVKRSGEPVEHDIPLAYGPDNPIDLLDLVDRSVVLAAGTVEPGTYDFIRIELEQDQSFVVESDGDRKDLRIPSEEIKIQGPFEVRDGELTDVLLDFDADASLVKTGPHQGEGGWLLRPVIVRLQ